MFSTFFKHQPIALTGIIPHVFEWVTSGTTDIIYDNPRYTPPKEDNNGIALYCVHGTADRVSAFRKMAGRLKELPSEIASLHLVSFDQRAKGIGIDDFAQQLLEKIILNKHQKVILVGHSRGAVVAAFCQAFLAKTAGIEVLSVISICGPFLGSHLALPPLSLASTSVAQMQISSDFLQTLADQMIASGVKYYYYAAENDWIVPPANAYLTQNCQAFTTLKRHGHLSILSSHILVESIQENLEQICKPSQLTLEESDFYDLNDDIMAQAARPAT